ncbi:Uncharacterized protein Fot_01743 [Forsythia ovata]|uniref:Uncharacterized protein n=1 Tax=Forsythia ovata TaxID=205694 RepID=A0ABD1X4X0_9LAMI
MESAMKRNNLFASFNLERRMEVIWVKIMMVQSSFDTECDDDAKIPEEWPDNLSTENDSRKAKRGREAPLRGVREYALHPRGVTQTSILPHPGWSEHINIESRQDELDPAILEKLLAPFAIAAALVHKYWTSTFTKAVDNAELIELLKLAEMYTSQSHVLNCELYKVLAMKVNELYSTVEGTEDIDELRAENKMLCSRLAISEDAMAKAKYRISMSETIQKLSVKARK